MGRQRRVVVVGGGISGLATAFHLTRGADVQVEVVEAAPRLGGLIRTDEVAGMAVDTGPDALLVRLPAMADLLTELDLDGLRRGPDTGGAYLWVRGRLRPLPSGSVFGVPDKLLPLLRTGVVSPRGFLRAGADLVLPRRDLGGDPTIAQVLAPRFGGQVFDNLIEPMLGGVHAGRATRLSARSTIPDVMALTANRRSVYLALRRRGAPRRDAGPALVSLDGGLRVLVESLAAAVTDAGARISLGCPVHRLQATPVGWALTAGDRVLDADDVVLTVPAWAAAPLLESVAPQAARQVAGIDYVGVATVTMVYPSTASKPLQGNGFLVPPGEGRLLVGCTWLTTKWPQLRERAEQQQMLVVRCMVGRDGDQVWADLDDEALVTRLRHELRESMGVTAEPLQASVRRLPAAMPQYAPGHADRLTAIDAGLPPGLRVTGAGYRGVGIASCVSAASTTAAAVLARALPEVAAR